MLFLMVFVIIANLIVGAAVWVVIDDKNENIYRWYASANEKLGLFGPIIQLLILEFWPVGIYFWLKTRRRS